MPLFTRHKDTASPETVAGSPTYDARIDPALSGPDIIGSERLAAQRDLHLFGDKSAPAQEFSHYQQQQPAPLLGQLAGLAGARDQIEQVVSRKQLPPFPGVELGHVPGFHAAPRTDPVLRDFQHFAQTAHLSLGPDDQTNSRMGRRRLGH